MRIELNTIKEIISDRFKINIERRSRQIPYIKARAIYSYIAYKYTNNSLDIIGKSLNNRTHATILHAVKTFDTFDDTQFKEDFRYVMKLVLTILEQDDILVLNNDQETEIEKLRSELLKANAKLVIAEMKMKKGVTAYKEINDLLSLEDESIHFICETRLKPALKMLQSKVANKDLIDKQKLTRTM